MAQQGVPMWPRETTGPRVLVECEDPAVQDGLERAFRAAGYATAACAGPASRHSGQCPLVIAGRCGLVEDADVVVQTFDPDRRDLAEVRNAIHDRCPKTPLVVEVSARNGVRATTALATCHTVRFPADAGAFVEISHTVVNVGNRRTHTLDQEAG